MHLGPPDYADPRLASAHKQYSRVRVAVTVQASCLRLCLGGRRSVRRRFTHDRVRNHFVNRRPQRRARRRQRLTCCGARMSGFAKNMQSVRNGSPISSCPACIPTRTWSFMCERRVGYEGVAGRASTFPRHVQSPQTGFSGCMRAMNPIAARLAEPGEESPTASGRYGNSVTRVLAQPARQAGPPKHLSRRCALHQCPASSGASLRRRCPTSMRIPYRLRREGVPQVSRLAPARSAGRSALAPWKTSTAVQGLDILRQVRRPATRL